METDSLVRSNSGTFTARLFPKGDIGLGLRIPECVSSQFIAFPKAEDVDARLTGHAFNYAIHECDCFTYDFGPQDVAYAEGLMVWVAGNQPSLVKTLGLKTGRKESFPLEDRTRIDNVAILSSMVVALTSEGCHVWILTTGESHCLRYRISTCGQKIVSVSGESLAFAYPIDPIDGERDFEVLTWTLKDQRLSWYSVASPIRTSAQNMMF